MSARLVVDGLRCASCVWVTEKVLERTAGVAEATVSYATGRATLRWDPGRVDLSTLAARIAARWGIDPGRSAWMHARTAGCWCGSASPPWPRSASWDSTRGSTRAGGTAGWIPALPRCSAGPPCSSPRRWRCGAPRRSSRVPGRGSAIGCSTWTSRWHWASRCCICTASGPRSLGATAISIRSPCWWRCSSAAGCSRRGAGAGRLTRPRRSRPRRRSPSSSWSTFGPSGPTRSDAVI